MDVRNCTLVDGKAPPTEIRLALHRALTTGHNSGLRFAMRGMILVNDAMSRALWRLIIAALAARRLA